MWIYLGLLLFTAPAAEGRETDDFTSYYTPVADSTAVLEDFVQRQIDKHVLKSTGCDLDDFTERLAKRLVNGSAYLGVIEKFAENDANVNRLSHPLAASVYAGTPFAQTLVASHFPLAPTVSVAGQKVGVDKLGHFIENGYYFQRERAKGAKFGKLIQNAVDEEEGYLGWTSSGVKSFGDMAADLDGEVFWANVSGRGPNPYLKCENGKLVKTRDFHFREYVTPAWNEANNCNQYKGEDLTIPSLDSLQLAVEALDFPTNSCDDYHEELRLSKVGEFKKAMILSMKDLERQHPGQRFTCPIDPERCREARKIYEERFGVDETAKLLSPECYAEGNPKAIRKPRAP